MCKEFVKCLAAKDLMFPFRLHSTRKMMVLAEGCRLPAFHRKVTLLHPEGSKEVTR